MQKIFNPKETKDRAMFTMFLQEHFLLRQRSTKTFKHPMSIDIIHKMYQSLYPETTLSHADLKMYFAIMGMGDNDHVFMDIRANHISQIPEILFKRIEAHLSLETLRKLDISSRAPISAVPGVNIFHEFKRLYVSVSISDNRTKTSRLYQLYTLYCLSKGINPIGRKSFARMVSEHISPIRKGYAEGVSGCNYALCKIPADEHWEQSIRFGIGIFVSYQKFFDNKGKNLQLDPDTLEITSDVIALYIKNRIEGESKYESTKTTEKVSQQEAEERGSDGRAIEGNAEHVSRREEAIKSKTYNDADETSDLWSEKSGFTSITEFEDREAGDKFSGITETDIEYANAELERLDRESADDYQEDPITIKEVYKALEIAYKISPTTFDKKTMNSYLVSMDVDFAAEDIWEDFMNYVGGE
jgi:hypothetical protein